MKKTIAIALVVICVFSIIGCSQKDTQEIKNASSFTETWRDAYVLFLRENIHLDNNSIIYEFALKDLDDCGFPELLVTQCDKDTALNAILTVYKYDSDVKKIGEYANQKGSFISGFRIPSDLMFLGLYDCWYGGGQEYCQYLSIKDGELIYENLWHIDRSGEFPLLTELSDNKQLIKDSIDAFPPYEYHKNLLEFYIINNENVDKVIKESNEW